MNLHKRLFFSVAALIILVIAPLYFFSHLWIEKDLLRAQEEVEHVVSQKSCNPTEVLALLEQLHHVLMHKLSLQILTLGVVLLLFSLIVMWLIARSITKPLEELVKETKKVASGQYEEITFPEGKKRHDEIAALAQSFKVMIEGLKEREKIRSVLDKVVSKDVADEILRSSLQLGGEDRIITILFCDIRNFSSITEHFTPQETISMLNQFMTKMTRVIEGEGGIIDKYVGDEIMALYGALVIYEDHAMRALSSAKIMVEALNKWNIERQKNHLPSLEVGIGIHTGLVVAGNMGADDRLNYTVLGSSVNLAARLCQAAKPQQILISEPTLKQPHIEDSFLTKALEPINVKGFSLPVAVYEILGFKWS